MKISHIIFLILAGLGVLFLIHLQKGHGGVKNMFNSSAT